MDISRANWSTCLLWWILSFVTGIICHNLDTKFPIIYEGTTDNYFGFSVGLLHNSHGYKALITAPRANSSALTTVHQPGVLFSCDITESSNVTPPCEEVVVDTKGNQVTTHHSDSNFSYKNKLDDMWLGVSLDIQRGSADNSVVVCGHLWKDQSFAQKHQLYAVNGVCYVVSRDLDSSQVKKLVPFVNKQQQVILGDKPWFAFAQAGTSVVFSEDGRYLLLGSPGYYDGTGIIVSYDMGPAKEMDGLGNPIIPLVSIGHRRSMSGYSGYSVTSGQFFGGNATYSAVGAPRDGNYHGMVFIFMPVDEVSKRLIANETIEGHQFGEYFGASVSGIDLNNDGFTDLLVGAPFHSEKDGGDEGRVYVYISDGVRLQEVSQLSGQKKQDARFGSCLSDVGDLNLDGFNDVAIGAPYEDEKGAIYIYHGTPEGLSEEYSQRISAGEIKPMISGFGISISRGLDVDDNYYPDLLIGAYSSSNAVLLRSHPVIQMISELRFDPPTINRNITACEFEGEKLSCFNVMYCLEYSGQHAPHSLEFKIDFYMDTDEKGNYRGPSRGFLLSNGTQQTSVSRNVTLNAGANGSCFQEAAYINRTIKDEITPIKFFLTYDLYHDEGNTSFCKNCPVFDSKSSKNITESVPFLVDCGPDNKCIADLVVKAHILGNPNNEALIIGQNDTLTLDVTVENRGETAYAPVLSILLPHEISIVKLDLCDIENDAQDQPDSTTLRCDFGNSIKTNEKVEVRIKFDPKRIPLNTSSLNLLFNVTTISEERNDDDNRLNLSLSFKAEADIGITGFTDDEQIPYKEEKGTASITHKYYVKNHGPSPVERIDIFLYVPSAVDGKNGNVDFLIFSELEVEGSDMAVIPQKCTSSFISVDLTSHASKKSKRHALGENYLSTAITEEPEIDNFADIHDIQKRSAGGSGTAVANRGDYLVDCETATCEKVHCIAGPFPDYQKFTKLILSAHLNLTKLNSAMDPWSWIEYVTKGKIFMDGEKVESETYPDEITVKTIIVHPGPPPSRGVETWIIVVSVVCGILLLLLILFALFKTGFFKRQQREKLKKMMFQADLKELTVEGEAATEENLLNAGHEDNNET